MSFIGDKKGSKGRLPVNALAMMPKSIGQSVSMPAIFTASPRKQAPVAD